MALPTSPPITLRQIATEFQAGGVVSLTDFYRGGGRVPNIPQNSNVPTSGAISLLDFLGATNYVDLGGSLTSINVEHTQGPTPPGPVRTEVYGTSTATATNGTGNYSYNWSIVSGGAQQVGSSTNSTFTIMADLLGNTEVTGQLRCVISDGVQSITRTAVYRLRYNRLA